MKKDIKFAEAILKQGYLRKQSPGLLKVYKNRFYTIRDKGNFLIWFKKKPTHHDQVPKGVIRILQIAAIEVDPKDNLVFFLDYHERRFKLKSDSTQQRDEWVNTLGFIKQYLKQASMSANKSIVGPLVRSNTMGKATHNQNQKKENWKWQNNQLNLLNLIQAQNQQIFNQDTQLMDENINPQKMKQLVKSQGLLFIQHEDLLDRLVYGFLLYKKPIVGYQLRWFFLLSTDNLKKEEDQRRLIFEDSPTWLKPNFIYIFQQPQQKNAIMNFRVADIIQVIVDCAYPPYKINIKTQDENKEKKQHFFSSRYLIEITKWQKSIKIIREKELQAKQIEQKKLKLWEKQMTLAQGQIICININNPKSISHEYKSYYNYISNPSYLILKYQALFLLKKKQQQWFSQKSEGGAHILVEVGQIKSCYKQQNELVIMIDYELRVKFKGDDNLIFFENKINELLMQKNIEPLIINFNENSESTNNANEIQNMNSAFLYKKIQQRRSTLRKNYYQMCELSNENMIVQKGEKQTKSEQGFWSKLQKMFCGGTSGI